MGQPVTITGLDDKATFRERGRASCICDVGALGAEVRYGVQFWLTRQGSIAIGDVYLLRALPRTGLTLSVPSKLPDTVAESGEFLAALDAALDRQ